MLVIGWVFGFDFLIIVPSRLVLKNIPAMYIYPDDSIEVLFLKDPLKFVGGIASTRSAVCPI